MIHSHLQSLFDGVQKKNEDGFPTMCLLIYDIDVCCNQKLTSVYSALDSNTQLYRVEVSFQHMECRIIHFIEIIS